MTPEKENERRANFIVKNAGQYGVDPVFKMMVDNTVYLTDPQKRESARFVGRMYGSIGYGERHGA